MPGAEGANDVQSTADKVTAAIDELKSVVTDEGDLENLDSMSAEIADIAGRAGKSTQPQGGM